MDVCPVGAITTRDYRFKSRPWDNPHAVDTICTMCEKGCNTTAWIKAKPEWAKGARLIRMTPRYNADVNQYWMCDLGRFDYHWIESDRRVLQPRLRSRRVVGSRVVGGCAGRRERRRHGRRRTGERRIPRVRARLTRRAVRPARDHRQDRAVSTLSWRHREKPQPKDTKFPIPAVDAPNVRGAKDLGFPIANASGPADVSSLKSAVDSGAREGALRARSRAGWIDRRDGLGHRREAGRQDLDAHRPGRSAYATARRRGHRAPRIGVRREGRDLHEHDRPRAGRHRAS